MKKQIIKWLARLLGGAGLIFIAVNIFDDGVPDLKDRIPAGLRSSLLLFLFSVFAWIFAWFREKEGGYALMIAAIIYGLNRFYSPDRGGTIAFFYFALPLFVPGILFWWYNQLKEN